MVLNKRTQVRKPLLVRGPGDPKALHPVRITRVTCLLPSFFISPSTPRPKWQRGSQGQGLQGQLSACLTPRGLGTEPSSGGRYSPGHHEHQLFPKGQEGQLLPNVGRWVRVRVRPSESKTHPGSPHDGRGGSESPSPQPPYTQSLSLYCFSLHLQPLGAFTECTLPPVQLLHSTGHTRPPPFIPCSPRWAGG